MDDTWELNWPLSGSERPLLLNPPGVAASALTKFGKVISPADLLIVCGFCEWPYGLISNIWEDIVWA
jgi:hypothetical protein